MIYYQTYIEIKLKEKLIKNVKYCGEFYYGLVPYGDSSYFSEKVKTLELEMLFTDTIVYKHEGKNTYWPQNIYTNAQISHKMQNKDTVNWIKVSGSFIAKGGEEYLTIGNFIPYDTSRGEVTTIIFIDDVSVYYCGPDTSIQTTKEIEIPNIFTPNGDGYNDVFEYKNQEDWDIETQIFNRWGELLFSESNENWDGKYKGKKVSEGVYFYKINAKAVRSGEIKVYNGVVHVIYN
jgi:gliding motility-associated-like protein